MNSCVGYKHIFDQGTDMGDSVLDAFKNSEINRNDWDECNNQTLLELHNYIPLQYHWFYNNSNANSPEDWIPFSKEDSQRLDEVYNAQTSDGNNIVAVEGSRYDVDISKRKKLAVYWTEEPKDVQRCSWFHKRDGNKFEPYNEEISAMLEMEYRRCILTNRWRKNVELPNKDVVTLHSVDIQLVSTPVDPLFDVDLAQNKPTSTKPRIVQRGIDESIIPEGESEQVDHVLFMVHGIGAVCDFKFRTVQAVVDVCREYSQQLIKAHYQTSTSQGLVSRVEVLPISWHRELHSDSTGVDNILKSITLETVPLVREITNNTILDVLFYTSPKYSQTISQTVGNAVNNLYTLYKKRNPKFKGKVSFAGHSLGSLILFDLLAHQKQKNGYEEKKKIGRRISSMYTGIGSVMTNIDYPQLKFDPVHLFALGSPIGMFLIVRGLTSLGNDFALPTCKEFFNIFHPYDPVAYRVESLINKDLADLPPVLMPHHKGRKRLHLELMETMSKIGSELKQKVTNSLKYPWYAISQLGMLTEDSEENQPNSDAEGTSSKTAISYGMLNNGRRIDYVLQESPLDAVSGYLAAITSHVCYWESQDTILFMIKQIYESMDITPDCQIPQATLTIQRPVDIINTDQP